MQHLYEAAVGRGHVRLAPSTVEYREREGQVVEQLVGHDHADE